MPDFWLLTLTCRGGDSCWKAVWHVDPRAPNNALEGFASIVATVGQNEIQFLLHAILCRVGAHGEMQFFKRGLSRENIIVRIASLF